MQFTHYSCTTNCSRIHDILTCAHVYRIVNPDGVLEAEGWQANGLHRRDGHLQPRQFVALATARAGDKRAIVIWSQEPWAQTDHHVDLIVDPSRLAAAVENVILRLTFELMAVMPGAFLHDLESPSRPTSTTFYDETYTFHRPSDLVCCDLT